MLLLPSNFYFEIPTRHWIMAYVSNIAALHRLFRLCRRPISSIPAQFQSNRFPNTIASSFSLLLFVHPNFAGKRWLSTNAQWADPPDFAGKNAYDVLGVSQTSSFEEIKASFRKLAKETHPDLAHAQSHSSHASKKFIQILAAYEVSLFLCKSYTIYMYADSISSLHMISVPVNFLVLVIHLFLWK